MEFKNVEELRAACPELIAQVEASAQAQGCAAERERIQGIEAIEAAIGDAEMVKAAKYGETTMTAEQLAFAAMKKQAAIGNQVVEKLENDAKNSGAAAVEAAPAPAGEEPKMTEDEQAEALLMSAIKNKEGK